MYMQGTKQHNYVGGMDSRLTAKLTNRLKSENTSLLVVWSVLGGVSDPVGGPEIGGDAKAASILSPVLAPGRRETRLLAGLVRLVT